MWDLDRTNPARVVFTGIPTQPDNPVDAALWAWAFDLAPLTLPPPGLVAFELPEAGDVFTVHVGWVTDPVRWDFERITRPRPGENPTLPGMDVTSD